MIGYVVVCSNDDVYSNGINKSLDNAIEDILHRKMDKYFMLDITEGYYASDMNSIRNEADFEVAVEGYISIAEWVIAINIDTNDVDIYYNGILVDKRNK